MTPGVVSAHVPLDAVYIPARLTPARHMQVADDSGEVEGDDINRVGSSLVKWLDSCAPATKITVVSGRVGSGKTELLRQTRRTLAERARTDAQAPLPLLITARALASSEVVAGGQVPSVAVEQLPLRGDLIQTLQAASSTEWLYLIDGLDEAPMAMWDRVRAIAQVPTCRARHVVVASRPPIPPLAARVLHLSPWTEGQFEQFLSAWEEYAPAAVRGLRASSQYQGGRHELFRYPLTATLCLAIVQNNDTLPPGRTQLFATICDLLFRRWYNRRGHSAISWRDVAEVVEDLALLYLREKRSSLRWEEVSNAVLAIEVDDTDTDMEVTLERAFGVFVSFDGGQSYDFLFRGLAEHLAGRALLRQGDASVIGAAGEPWGEEVVRHAVGYDMLRNHGDGTRLLRQLVAIETRGLRDLRSLLIAIRVAADMGEKAAGVAEDIALATAMPLFDETSHWIGERIATAVRELAAAGGPVMKLLWQYCRMHLQSRREPITWYQAQEEQAAEFWLAALQDRDAGVRILACERLAPYVDDPVVRNALLLMCLDDSYFPAGQVPLVAGSILRQAQRDEHFVTMKQTLISMLDWREQFPPGAAALALRPDEVEPARLAWALRRSFEGCKSVPRKPIEELARAPGGKAALDEAAPGWEEWLADHFHLRWAPIPKEEYLLVAPPSSFVRWLIVRAFGPGWHHLDPADRTNLPRSSVEDLCRAALHRPELLLSSWPLGGQPPRIVPYEAQKALGRAALRHEAIRTRLIDDWILPDSKRDISDFPGIALEPLVIRGDSDAIEIYSKWLDDVSLYGFPNPDFPSPDPAVFRHSLVAESGYRKCLSAWRYATKGRVKEGQRTRLHATTAGILLNHFWPIWIDDTDFVSQISRWIRSPQIERFNEICYAFDGVHLPQEIRTRLIGQLRSRLLRYLRILPNQ